MSLLLALALSSTAPSLDLPDTLRCDLAVSDSRIVSFGVNTADNGYIFPIGSPNWTNKRASITSKEGRKFSLLAKNATIEFSDGTKTLDLYLARENNASLTQPQPIKAGIFDASDTQHDLPFGKGFCYESTSLEELSAGLSDLAGVVVSLSKASEPNNCIAVGSDGRRGAASVEILSGTGDGISLDDLKFKFDGDILPGVKTATFKSLSGPPSIDKNIAAALLFPRDDVGVRGWLFLHEMTNDKQTSTFEFVSTRSEGSNSSLAFYCGQLLYSKAATQ